MVKLYLDGCSFTYGLGLEEKDTLAFLFKQAGYEVFNNSRPGKSNHAIALDTYNNLNKFDLYILGFTFSNRYHLRIDNIEFDMSATRYTAKIPDKLRGSAAELMYQELHKNIYTLYDNNYWHEFSNMLIDNTLSGIKLTKKQFFVFSWENRKLINEVFFPMIPTKERLPDGHLNKQGTLRLFNVIQNNIGDPGG